MTTYSENGLEWTQLDSRYAFPEIMGLIPSFLHEQDPRSARDQFKENYAHGGGWSPMKSWTMKLDTKDGFTQAVIKYPGDLSIQPVAITQLRDERIFIYPDAWVLILQPNGDFEVARMD